MARTTAADCHGIQIAAKTRMTLKAVTFTPSGVAASIISKVPARQKQTPITTSEGPSWPRLQVASGALPTSCDISRRTLLLHPPISDDQDSARRAVRCGTLYQR
jgi:hypothetical protein